MLTTHILIKNNESTIEDCIRSLLPLNGEIKVYDLGSRDETKRCCEFFGILPKSIVFKDLDKTRNKIVDEAEYDWQFYIEPWEVLKYGHDNVNNYLKESPENYKFLVIQGSMISKETRLWHRSNNLKFINPVYETLNDEKAKITDGVIFSGSDNNQFNKLNLARKWKKDTPTAAEPYYYLALALLEQGNYDEFLSTASFYLYKGNDPKAAAMLQYYCAMVLCHVKKNGQKTIEHLIRCLATNALMAEFWCLLGDTYYSLSQEYKKAHKFYQNAIALGSKRLKNDDWPMDVTKYKQYPQKMMESCEQLIKNTTHLAK